MTPKEFFESVAEANARLAAEHFDDPRHAINAILTLDAFFGILHASLYAAATPGVSDDDSKWKEQLACESNEYRLLRDTAFALKHGNLTRGPRLIRRADQLFAMPGAFQANVFQRNVFQTGQVWIETEETDYRADEIIDVVCTFARAQLALL